MPRKSGQSIRRYYEKHKGASRPVKVFRDSKGRFRTKADWNRSRKTAEYRSTKRTGKRALEKLRQAPPSGSFGGGPDFPVDTERAAMRKSEPAKQEEPDYYEPDYYDYEMGYLEGDDEYGEA